MLPFQTYFWNFVISAQTYVPECLSCVFWMFLGGRSIDSQEKILNRQRINFSIMWLSWKMLVNTEYHLIQGRRSSCFLLLGCEWQDCSSESPKIFRSMKPCSLTKTETGGTQRNASSGSFWSGCCNLIFLSNVKALKHNMSQKKIC